MRDLKCKLGTGNVVAAVVAVLEKQANIEKEIYDADKELFRRNFQESSRNCSIELSETSATQSAAATKNSERSLENSIFGVLYSGGSKEDESFRSAVEDFDSVAEDVRKNFVKTDSLRRRRETVGSESGEVDGSFRVSSWRLKGFDKKSQQVQFSS